MFTNLLWRLQLHQVEDVHILENLALILVSEEPHVGNHYCAFCQRLSRHDAEGSANQSLGVSTARAAQHNLRLTCHSVLSLNVGQLRPLLDFCYYLHIDLKSATIIQYTIKGRFMSR